MVEPIRVAVVDDHRLFLEGLLRSLRRASELEVVAAGTSAEDARTIARDKRPDVLLLDIGIPGGGIEAATTIATESPSVKIIMLTGSDEEDHVFRSLRAGASGYVLKGIAGAELREAICAVHSGVPYVSQPLASRLLISALETPARKDYACVAASLTEREQKILARACEGRTNKEIAAELDLSEPTIKFHMGQIMRKMGVRNRVEAAMAVREK